MATSDGVFEKDPDAVLPYAWDWAAWLAGDTIATHTVTADDGVTVDSSNATSTAVTAWLSGGTAGATYSVRCRVTTAGGKTDDRTIVLQVRQR